MRILIHDYAGHPFPVQLSRELARRGHSVTHAFAVGLLTPRGILSRLPQDPSGLEFRPVEMSPNYRKNKYSFVKRLGYERRYGKELVKLTEEVRPQIILSGQTPSEPQLAFLRAAQRARVPMVTWVQDFYSLAVDKLARKKLPIFGALAGSWYRRLDRLCFSSSAAMVAITQDFVPVLKDFGVAEDKILVVPNWAPLDEITLEPHNNEWSFAQGLHDKFVFLYSGTLAMKHNPGLLLELARRFNGVDEVRVVVISEGPGADYLQASKDKEKLHGLILLPFQEFAAMSQVLGCADVALANLETDAGLFSVPSKVLTYHAAGKPILAAMPKENLAARIISAEGSGICVEPSDTEGFIDGARKLFTNQATRKEMGRVGRVYAEREFDIRQIASRFEKLFSGLV